MALAPAAAPAAAPSPPAADAAARLQALADVRALAPDGGGA
jgi:hypothetical protein